MSLARDVPISVPHAFRANAAALRDAPALWTRRGRSWKPTSWRELAVRVRHLAAGLGMLGVGAGHPIGILSSNREEWWIADVAAMSVGAVPVGLHTTFTAEQLQTVLGHCEASVLVVENADLLNVVRQARAGLPKLQHILLIDGPSIRREGVHAFEEVLQRGAGRDAAEWDRQLEALRPEALAALAYTFDHEGAPLGVMLSHRNLCWTTVALSEALELEDDDVVVSYLPLARIAERVCTEYAPLLNGMQVFFAPDEDDLPQALDVARPTVFFAPRRIWERLKARAQEALETPGGRRQQWVDWARTVTQARHVRVLRHERPPLRAELQYQASVRTVFAPMKRALGLDRTRLFATSVAPISRDLLDFFSSVDILIRELFGQTEVTGPASLNTLDATRFGSVGQPMLGIEVCVADDGEVRVRGESVCLGYYKNDEATAALLQDGWLRTGDMGELDGEGFLRITGRKLPVTRGARASGVG